MRKITFGQIILNFVFILLSLSFVIPLIYTISISFSAEKDIILYGYKLIPKQISLDAWKLLLGSGSPLLQAYKVTAFVAILGTALSVLFMSMFAYTQMRNNCAFRGFLTKYMLVTMLFSGGTVPSYILMTRYLHIDDTVLVYLLPGLISAYNVIVIRANFKNTPFSLIESAKLDGAGEIFIFFKIMMPLNIPTIAAIAFLTLVTRWNDWYTSLLYIRNPQLYSLQYLLQRILREVEYLKEMALSGQETVDLQNIPSESYRYAIAIAASGPMLIIFPVFEKYFVKGLTIGSVKG